MKIYYQASSLKLLVCCLCANRMQITKKIILEVLFSFTPQFCFSSINFYVNSSEMLGNGLASHAKKYTFVSNADFLHTSFNAIYAYLKYMHLWKNQHNCIKVNSKFEILLISIYGKLLHIHNPKWIKKFCYKKINVAKLNSKYTNPS